jgi:rubrerythrin
MARGAATRSPRRGAAISLAAMGSRSARSIRPAGRLEFRCPACGYGIVVSAALPSACPMCHATAWTPSAASHPKGQQ